MFHGSFFRLNVLLFLLVQMTKTKDKITRQSCWLTSIMVTGGWNYHWQQRAFLRCNAAQCIHSFSPRYSESIRKRICSINLGKCGSYECTFSLTMPIHQNYTTFIRRVPVHAVVTRSFTVTGKSWKWRRVLHREVHFWASLLHDRRPDGFHGHLFRRFFSFSSENSPQNFYHPIMF